jgi:hypothetical protein
MMGKRLLAWAAAALVLAFAGHASAFTHIVRPGETLAQIATRVYGAARDEAILVGANALDAQGGSAIVPGFRLEIPAPGHHRVAAGETWPALALTWLGDATRADLLARANHTVSWVPPVEGLEIEIPAVIAHIAAEGDNSTRIAERYLGDMNRGWEINMYNGNRKEAPLRRGEILLVPLLDLALTEGGKAEARSAEDRATSEGSTSGLEVQRRADTELPLLLADVRWGRYVEAVARGNRVLGSGELTRPELATLHRALLEAYVALDAVAAATAACAAWRANDPAPKLEPRSTSPKIRAACAAAP